MGAAALPPRHEPGLEARAAVEIVSLQELAGKQVGKPGELLGFEGFRAAAQCRFHVERIDRKLGEIKGDMVVGGANSGDISVAQQRPDFGERPA